jgi:pyruvate formate lyase activating enzyme
METTQGTVFNIQRFSVDDGPGIRTTVFLKGCPLRCKHCCNPEGLEAKPQLLFKPDYCIGTKECGYCLDACTEGAIRTRPDGKVEIDFKACTNCGKCASVCPSKALETVGRTMTVDEVLAEVETEESFHVRSGGGLTLSGGEVLQQAGFARALLEAAKQRGMSTAIETSGMGNWKLLEALLPFVDVIHYDIKCLDKERHRRFTGVANDTILRNFKRLCEVFPHDRIVVRTPFVPGVNGSVEDVREIGEFLRSIAPDLHYELLPYHGLGQVKYGFLGLEYTMDEVLPTSGEAFEHHRMLTRLRARERATVPLTPAQGRPLLERMKESS